MCVCVAHTRFDACNNACLLYVSMCVCDVSPQERLMHVVLHTVLL